MTDETSDMRVEVMFQRAARGEPEAFPNLAKLILSRAPPEYRKEAMACAELLYRIDAGSGDKLAIGRLSGVLLLFALDYHAAGNLDEMVTYAGEAIARLDRLADRDEETAAYMQSISDLMKEAGPELAARIAKAAAEWQFDGEPA